MSAPSVPRSSKAVEPAAAAVSDLTIDVGESSVLSRVSLSLARGEILGLVGETGSGKTTLGLALLGHCRTGMRVTAGSVAVGEQDMLHCSEGDLRARRGSLISYVPQDPGASLDPGYRLGPQLDELLAVHGLGDRKARRARAARLLGEVDLPSDVRFLRRYPHELSGGQQQRFALAMAFANQPAVVVLDEPTTGLDVATQARIIETIRTLRSEHGTAMVFVSHDLELLLEVADRLAVMYAGRIVETGTVADLAQSARHPYALGLLAAVPRAEGEHRLVGIPGQSPPPRAHRVGCDFAPRCPYVEDRCRAEIPDLREVAPGHAARCLRVEEVARLHRAAPLVKLERRASAVVAPVARVEVERAAHGRVEVLDDVTVTLPPGTCVALVGESGSGKTTLARCLAGLHTDYRGVVEYDGAPIAAAAGRRPVAVRQAIQYVFQNPYSSLNPRRRIGDIVAQPGRTFLGLDARAARGRAVEALARMELGEQYAARYPHELSGGERQRVAIARALMAEPRVLICDEVTSALDVSVQASIVNLLADLQRDSEMAMLFITHDLQLVRMIAQSIVVLSAGRVVEEGTREEVLHNPQDPYTKSLLAAKAG
ncbi:MAG: ABC transporter ATP-binding protein [Actinobacteria bacterium]|nr:ABC transporter ATP-binding protein [Actinomycetota bacterium]